MTFRSLAVLTALVASPAFASEWKIDSAHSEANFRVKHLTISWVEGSLGPVTGTVHMDDKDVTKSSVEASIDVTQLATREPKRDAHLKSPDFFDVAKFPTATFKSTKIAKAGKGKLKVTGDLTLHGITKSVVLDVEGPSEQVKDPWGNTKVALTATTVLDRHDFGLNWNNTLQNGGLIVGKDVYVTIPMEAALDTGEKKASN